MDGRTAVLIAAVLAPTDAAAVFTVARGLRLPARLQTLIEAESGLNDAPVVVLVVLLSTTAAGDLPAWLIPIVVIAELVGGLLIGGLVGLFARWLLPRLALPASGLYPVAVIALLMLAYGLAAVLHTSGFAAVYVVALILAASPLPHRRAVLGFIEGLAWTVQIGLFVMLGLLAFPSRLGGCRRDRAAGRGAAAGRRTSRERRWPRWARSCGPGGSPARPGRSRCPGSGWRSPRGRACAGAVPIIFATIPLGSDLRRRCH